MYCCLLAYLSAVFEQKRLKASDKSLWSKIALILEEDPANHTIADCWFETAHACSGERRDRPAVPAFGHLRQLAVRRF
jgi:hypothetical protein